jgi:hypothetical protein
MKFDFDQLVLVYKEDPLLFEVYREKILKAAIDRAPTHLQADLSILQLDLNEKRKSMSTEKFLDYCRHKIEENLDDIEDQMNCAKVLAEKLS